MRAILIDPTTKTVSETEYSGDYHDITKLIAAESGLFTVVRLSSSHVMYVDDEGLLVNPNPNGYFRLEGYPTILAGKGLIVGSTPDGNDVETSIPVSVVEAVVTFVDNPDPEDIEPTITVTSF